MPRLLLQATRDFWYPGHRDIAIRAGETREIELPDDVGLTGAAFRTYTRSGARFDQVFRVGTDHGWAVQWIDRGNGAEWWPERLTNCEGETAVGSSLPRDLAGIDLAALDGDNCERDWPVGISRLGSDTDDGDDWGDFP